MPHVRTYASPRSPRGRPPVKASHARRWRFALTAVLALLLLLACAGFGAATASASPPTIIPSTGLNGTVTPSVAQAVTAGTPAIFTITPAAGYQVADVKVDGSSVGAVGTYTFANATAAAHTIVATFAADTIVPWQLQQPMPSAAVLGGVAFTDADHGWVVGGGIYGFPELAGAHGKPALPATSSSLGVSSDGGATWTSRSGLPVNAARNNTALGASTRSGAVGIAVWGSGTSASLCVAGTSAAAGSSGMAYSHDGGATWTGVDTFSTLADDYPGLEDVILRDVAFTSATRVWACGAVDVYSDSTFFEVGVVLESNDGGATWNEVYGLPETADQQSMFTGLSATDGDHCWVAGGDEDTTVGLNSEIPLIYATSNGGTSWQSQSPDAANKGMLFDVAMSGDGLHGWAVGMYIDGSDQSGTVYTTSDSGVTWTQQAGATDLGPSYFTAATFTSATSAVAVGFRGDVLRGSTSNGVWTWQYGQSANTIALAGVASTGVANKLCAVGVGGDVQTSADGGVTWTYRGALTGNTLTAVSSVDATHGWVVGDDNTGAAMVAATSNGGSAWVPQLSLSTSVNLTGVDFLDLQHGWAVGDTSSNAGQVGFVCATTDGGATWSQQTLDQSDPLNAVDFVDATHGWAVGDQGTIIRTTDGGSTWSAPTTMPVIDGSLYAVDFVDATHGWAVGSTYDESTSTTEAVVLVTSDGGDTWTQQSTSVDAYSLTGVSFADVTHGWAVGFSLDSNYVSSPMILATSDGGAHWAAQSVPALAGSTTALGDVTAVRFIDSQNGWAMATPARIAGPARGYALASVSALLVTHDGGVTWTQDGDAWTTTQLIGLDASRNGHAWAVGTGGTILSHPLVPPTTTVTGLPGRWVRRTVKLGFVGMPSAGGALIAYTECRVGSGAWTQIAALTIKRQGTTTILYRSTDTAGNVQATQTCKVRIDKTKPTVRDIGGAHAWSGGHARFSYRLGDKVVHGVNAKLVITRYNRHVASKKLGLKRTGRRLVASWRCNLPTGTYSWRIVATDPAGNRRAGTWHYLVVYPGRHNR